MRFLKKSATYLIPGIASLFAASCGTSGKENENITSSFVSLSRNAGVKYVIDKGASVVTWTGSMTFNPLHAHKGYVYLSTGELIMEKDQLVGGSVEIDMNSIEYSDKQHPNSPIMHLKSPDFFDVEKFPAAAFTITEVEPANGTTAKITGNLTVKGITQSITFPASIEVKGDVIHATGHLVIDRTRWGIRYKSGKFYDDLADEAISDDIALTMEVAAKR